VNDAESAWEDGGERPVTNANGLVFAEANFTTLRRNYATMLGNQAIAMGSKGWKVMEHHVGSLVQQEITARTNRVCSLIDTAANWGNNTADANTLNNGAGTWDLASDDPASANYNAIKRSLMEAVRRITLATNATVGFNDLQLVISPGLAESMGNSAEIHNYLRNGPYSRPRLESKEDYVNDRWGLPATLYGLPLVVEDTVKVTDRPAAGGGTGASASSNRVFAKADKTAVILSRPGSLDGEYGAPSFSTVQVYWHEYLAAVYTFQDQKNARTELHVTSQYVEILAAPESGFCITNATA